MAPPQRGRGTMIWSFLRPLVWCHLYSGDGSGWGTGYGDGYYGGGGGNGAGEGYNYGHGAGDHYGRGSDFYGGRN